MALYKYVNYLLIIINVFGFVKNFLTDRTIQVKVGNALSQTYLLENGTAQRSVISPLLFLIMINDLPDYLYIYIFISPNHGSSVARNNVYIYKQTKKKKKLNYIIQFIYKQKRRRKNLTTISS